MPELSILGKYVPGQFVSMSEREVDTWPIPLPPDYQIKGQSEADGLRILAQLHPDVVVADTGRTAAQLLEKGSWPRCASETHERAVLVLGKTPEQLIWMRPGWGYDPDTRSPMWIYPHDLTAPRYQDMGNRGLIVADWVKALAWMNDPVLEPMGPAPIRIASAINQRIDAFLGVVYKTLEGSTPGGPRRTVQYHTSRGGWNKSLELLAHQIASEHGFTLDLIP